MARILLLSLSPITSDPRVMRQIGALCGHHELHVLGFGLAPVGVACFVPVATGRQAGWHTLRNAGLLATKRYQRYYWGHAQVQALLAAAAALPFHAFDMVLANDVWVLPAALRLAKGAPVWLDAHEYAPREFEDRPAWRWLLGPFFDAVCRRDLPHVARMSTVCEGIAREYTARYGVPVAVMPNCPDPVDLPVQPVQLGRIRLIHHGAAIASRRIGKMIDLMHHLDERFELDLMLVEHESATMTELRQRAAGNTRIRFIPPVAMADIAAHTNVYDIGLFLLPPTNFNYLHALPNKFFEFMQARLAIAIGPSPEMKVLVESHGCGIVSPSFEPADLARLLNALTTADIDAMKRASDRASRTLNAAATRAWLQSEVAAVVAAPGADA